MPTTEPVSPTSPDSPDSSGAATRPAHGRRWWWWFALTSVAITVLAVGPYLTASLAELSVDDHGVASNYVDRPAPFRVALYLHASFAGVALLLSPLQFATRLRRRRPRIHRAVGRMVLAAILVSGLAGLVLSFVNEAGPIGVVGFGGLALAWLACAGAAYRTARRRDLAAHRRWAIRTFALTYAGVTLRLQTILLVTLQVALGGDADLAFDRAYYVVTLSSWVPNLLVAEWYLRRGRGR
ncbi:DUF2306 domain-containing protein [Nocardioides humi]|uniref:Membrane protein DUF2306 n=1 Tax=Nocardioides humi TaxID=449461 RepID=A0ABN1ZVU5_9ACTN|nr:DUF2306 domain-containing protein [Nocardioides humi]